MESNRNLLNIISELEASIIAGENGDDYTEEEIAQFVNGAGLELQRKLQAARAKLPANVSFGSVFPLGGSDHHRFGEE